MMINNKLIFAFPSLFSIAKRIKVAESSDKMRQLKNLRQEQSEKYN
jgi:hypothetical protein